MYYTDLTDAQRVLQFIGSASKPNQDLYSALEIAKRAYEKSLTLDDAGLIARSLFKLSEVYESLGETKHAIHHIKEAIGIYEVIGDEYKQATSKFQLAEIYYRGEDFYLSLVYLLDSLTIYNKTEDFFNIARVQNSLGAIYEYFGDHHNAIMAYEKSIDAAKKAGELDLESDAYNALSGVLLKLDEVMGAEELIEKAFQMKQKSHDTRGLAYTLYGKGKVYMKKGFFDRANDAYQEAIRLHREAGEHLGLGLCYRKLGEMHFEAGDYDQAIKSLKGAITFASMYNLTLIKSKSNQLLYKIYKKKGELEKAIAHMEEYLADREELLGAQTQKVIDSYEAVTTMERLQWDAENQKEKAEILEKQRKAEQASKMKQDFLSTMSHEIRTPLNAVTTITSLLQDNPRVDQIGLLKSLSFSTSNLLRIINDILDFNKLDVGKLRIQPIPVDFPTLMKNIKSTYENSALEKGVEFNLFIDEQVYPYYLVDETRISQVLGNLVSNAIKFTDRGEVNVKVEHRGSTEDGDGDRLYFEIKDTGIGISEEFLPEMFDSFTQPQFHKTKRYGGSGLGLAIVKKILELHSSDITVESKEGQGSTFYFELTFQRSEPPQDKLDSRKRALMDKTILLAEDNMVNAMVSMRLLKNWGLRTIHAGNGEEAVQLAQSQPFDCILMDIHMPRLDGVEATRMIRKSDSGPNKEVPIYALTADVMAGQSVDFARLFDGVLLKPIEQEKLYNALATI